MNEKPSRVEVQRTDSVTLISIDAVDAGTSGWTEDVQEPIMQVLSELNELAESGSAIPVTAVVNVSARSAGALESALLQGIRGAIGTAALEFGPISNARANVVVTSDESSPADIAAVLTYLSDEARGGYTTGATIDIRRAAREDSIRDGVVLITGAAGGLGFAAASAIVASGRRVVLTDRPGAALESAGSRLGVPVVPCDLTSESELDDLASEEALGDLQAVVVHHGVGASSRYGADYDYVGASRSLVLNARSVHDVVERFLPRIIATQGTVIVLSSQAGLVAEAGNSAYCAAKFSANGYVESLVSRMAGSGATAQCLCPGPVDTPLMRAGFAGQAEGLGIDPEEFTRSRLRAIPLGRAGEPGQIGASSALLLQLNATGVVLAPTGGETLS